VVLPGDVRVARNVPSQGRERGGLLAGGARQERAYLDGGNTYKLSVPVPVPAELFWSVTVYDAETRSEIQTTQDRAALRSLFETATPEDNAVDLYFGPVAPAGKEGQWVQTIPSKGWFAYFRIYGPLEPAFDGSWRPGDFENVS